MKTLVEHYSGSIAYWTNWEGSDTDIRGIYVPEIWDKLLWNFLQTVEFEWDEDKVLFELSFFMDLAIQNNPNILESLFVDEKHILKTSKSYELLRKHRDEFLSKKVANTYLNYAKAQIKRLENHKVWIDKESFVSKDILWKIWIENDANLIDFAEEDIEKLILEKWLNRKDFPMLVRPKHSEYLKVEFNFWEDKHNNSYNPELLNELKTKMIAKKMDGNMFMCFLSNSTEKKSPVVLPNWNLNVLNSTEFNLEIKKLWISLNNPNLLMKFCKDEYEKASDSYEWFKKWKTTRNSKRLELERHHWYDTKHMLHTVRLLKQWLEILEWKGLIVNRDWIDAEYLKSIKKWEFKYEDIIKDVDNLIAKFDKAIIETKLPAEPIVDKDKLMLEIYSKEYWIKFWEKIKLKSI